MGTNTSVERFDGIRLEHYMVEGSNENLKRVFALIEMPDNELWVGTGMGLFRLADDAEKLERLAPEMINWREIFKDAAIFHWSGIDAALTPGLAEVCKEAIDIAKEMGLTISYDINYRKNLWNYGKTAQEVLRPLMTIP